jgi:hypothetical protein
MPNYLVASNDGDWDTDMWGVVGVIHSPDEFHQFVSDRIGSDQVLEYGEGEMNCLQSFEDNQVSLFCEGTVLSYLQTEDLTFYLIQL